MQRNERLARYSTLGIGGPADWFCCVKTAEEMRDALRWARDAGVPTLVIGKGSNCLFADEGFRGLAILNRVDFCAWNGLECTVGGGYSFSLLGVQSARKGLSGLEFASGIPASVGGAVFMNAGANGKETADALVEVEWMSPEGVMQRWARSELRFSYRHSPFQEMGGAIVSARFVLTPHEEARTHQLQILDYRLKTQPYKDKSAGCIFRNPPGAKGAGALIDQCGLKGVRVGGAKVSEMHANFLVNVDRATAEEVQTLILLVQKRVFEETGYFLEPEVRIIAP